MNEIACLIQVHDESQYLRLVEMACQSITQQSIPVDKFAFYDTFTPTVEILLLQKYGFNLIQTPAVLVNNICLKQVWAFEQLAKMGYKYIMINQSDDFADSTRAEKQKLALDQYANCGVCLCGYDMVSLENIITESFKQASCGWSVGFPSCWMINTRLVPKLPPLPGFEIPHEVEWDPYTLLVLQTQTSFVVLEESLEVYNNHPLNHVHKLDPKQFQRAIEELSRYFEFIKPQLHSVYTIPFRLAPHPNPKIEDFNQWRTKYLKLTYQENLEYHKRWAIEYPDQQHFYTGLDVIKQCTTPCKSIMEIGGWTGDLAGIILKEKTNIQRWDNYDLIEPPSHCPDSRYRTHIRENWLWKTDPLTQQYDVLVASNVLEHMTYDEVHCLFNWLPKIPIVVVVLPYLQRNWHNYHGAHIYRGMIDHFIAQIESHGYNLQYHQTRITREEVLVFSLDPTLLPKQLTPEEKDRALWKQWRKEEGSKDPHIKFQEWKKHQ